MGTIVQRSTEFYLKSKDFNGIPLADLFKQIGPSEAQFKKNVLAAIQKREIDLIYEGGIPNPHIKPFPAPKIEEQIAKLASINIEESLEIAEAESDTFGDGEVKIRFAVDNIGCCIYPTPEHLRSVVDWRQYASRPFTLRLAMGEWQLRPYFFELGILAMYRNDPRYRYHTDDITGSFSAVSEELLNSSDQVFVQHFGFGFDERHNRAVAILLTDLSKLTPEHQQIWKAKMLGGFYRFKLHPDFRRSILGHFYEGDSIFTAFVEELRIINEMSTNIMGVPLFQKMYQHYEKPENFCFLLLPTQREFEQFAQTLDHMLSDNINEQFFKGVISVTDLASDEKLEDIKSIRKLEIWLNKKIRFPDPEPKEEMLRTFRAIRRLRSKPAHTYVENEWNVRFLSEQKELIKRAYRAIRTLRLILSNNPANKMVEIPNWLQNGEIRTF